MSEIDTKEALRIAHDLEEIPWAAQQGCKLRREAAATLRALAAERAAWLKIERAQRQAINALSAERDALDGTLTNERKRIEALQQFMASQGARIDRIEEERDAFRASAAAAAEREPDAREEAGRLREAVEAFLACRRLNDAGLPAGWTIAAKEGAPCLLDAERIARAALAGAPRHD